MGAAVATRGASFAPTNMTSRLNAIAVTGTGLFFEDPLHATTVRASALSLPLQMIPVPLFATWEKTRRFPGGYGRLSIQ
jgi:hypothetical protein